MNEANLSESESLKLITEMIGKAKSSYHSNGLGAIMWGSVIFFCSVFDYVRLQLNFHMGFDIWWLMFIALVPQFYMMFRNRGKKNFITYEETTMSYVWSAFAASIVMLMFYSNIYETKHGISLFLMLFGMPTFITGGMFRFKPMIFGGIICWILFAISLYINIRTGLLLMAAAALFAWLIPGLILRNKRKAEAQQ